MTPPAAEGHRLRHLVVRRLAVPAQVALTGSPDFRHPSPMTTEVYSCKEGQSLKQGKLDYAAHITTKEEAEADAKRRCQRDPSLKKIAYYKVSPDGEFRVFYSYVNPNCKPAPKLDPGKPAVKTVKKPAKKPPPKKGFFARIKKSLGL